MQLLTKGAEALGGECLLCSAPSRGARVCDACDAAIATIGTACPRCALPLPRAETCGRCLRRPPEVDGALAMFEYRFPVDRVLARFKFAGDLAAGRWLGERLALAVQAAPAPDLIVVPPIDAARLRRRGFNQALEIAKVVAASSGLPLDRLALRRVRAAAPQSTLGGRERRRNLLGAFACSRRLDGCRVAIVDDVMTTGATIDAAARALRHAGAAQVHAWVVARTPEPGD